MTSPTRGLAAGTLAAVLALAGCGALDNLPRLERTLDDASGSAEIVVSDLVPNATKIAIVCPYSGFGAADLFGREVFKGYEDTVEDSNWFVWEGEKGALVKEELSRTKVEMCGGDNGVSGLLELAPNQTLVFEEDSTGTPTWRLTGVR